MVNDAYMTARPKIKGFEPLLSTQEISLLMGKPARFVLGLIKSGALKAVKLGGNSWRVRPEEWRRFTEAGATGYRHAKPSGGIRQGMNIKAKKEAVYGEGNQEKGDWWKERNAEIPGTRS